MEPHILQYLCSKINLVSGQNIYYDQHNNLCSCLLNRSNKD